MIKVNKLLEQVKLQDTDLVWMELEKREVEKFHL